MPNIDTLDSAGTPSTMSSGTNTQKGKPEASSTGHKRLILCFDGTGNSFQGNPGDTNIVKLYDMLDRSDSKQMHYYQPGIGTYGAEGASVDANFFVKMQRSFSQALDKGFATTFDSHIIAGYRFLMRYYTKGDRIYMFGFSRGAFTARFLARMIAHVGLLSMGNEEMVPFAYKVYQNYETGVDKEGSYMKAFRSTFCRHENNPGHPNAANGMVNGMTNGGELLDDEAGVNIHFLGLFDTVSSVSILDVGGNSRPQRPIVHGTANHVRHAVAIDERRVKFKAALFSQDKTAATHGKGEDLKEVWFPGNHGDIGGGWLPESSKASENQSFWGKLWDSLKWKWWWEEEKKVEWNKSTDPFQLSDIALKWMLDELNAVDESYHGSKDPISFEKDRIKDFFDRFDNRRDEAIVARMHDTMAVGGGSSLGKTILWNFMEYLPFIIRRWEYDSEQKLPWAYQKLFPFFIGRCEHDPEAKSQWVYQACPFIIRHCECEDRSPWVYQMFPLNKAACRDIPHEARLHCSVVERMQRVEGYRPGNDIEVGRNAARRRLKDVAAKIYEFEPGAPVNKPFFLVHAEGKGKKALSDRILQLKIKTN